MMGSSKRFLFLIFFLGLMVTPVVFAPGPGPPELVEAYVINVPEGVNVLQADDITTDLSLVGTADATKTALLTKTVSGTQYPVLELVIDYTTNEDSDDNVTNVSVENVVMDLDLTSNKVVATSPGTNAVSALSKMYVPKIGNANAIVVCDGATSLAQTVAGCGSNSGVTEETIYLEGYTGRYTVSSYSFGGNDYWEVSGVTGTGLQIFSLDFGGGDDLDFATEGEIINLDEGVSRNVVSRENVEYFVVYGGSQYKLMVRSVDVGNEFASIYVEGKDNIIPVKIDDSIELDLNQDGQIDIVLYVENIKYPDVYLTIALYSEEGFTFEPRDQTEVSEDRGAMFGSGDLWSRFIGDEGGNKAAVFIYLVAGLIFVGFLVMFGSRLIGKIWQAT